MSLRLRYVALLGGIAIVSPLGVNAALQAAAGVPDVPAAANVRGYGVLSQEGGAATAVANVAGTTARQSRAQGAGDARGTAAAVSVSVRATRTATGSTVVGVVRARGIRLFDGRVTIASLDAQVTGRADLTTADGGVDSLQVGEVIVDGVPVPAVPGSVVDVPGAGQFALGESGRDAAGVTQVNVLRVSAEASPGLAPLVVGHFTITTNPGPHVVTSSAAAPKVRTAPRAPQTLPHAGAEPGRPDHTDVAPPVKTPPRSGPAPVAPAPVAPAPALPTAPKPGTAPVLPTPHLLPGTTPAASAFTGVRGNVFPVQGAYTFSPDYGAPRAGTGSHHGNDVFAPVGTPVVAVADGRLSKVGWNTLGGNRLWLTDVGGTSYYYAHLSAYSTAASDGAIVNAGEVIGYVGNTGQAATTPPHLHFEMHPGGVAAASIDPYPFLKAWEATTTASPGIAQASTAEPVARDAGAGAVVVGVHIDVPQPPRVGDGIATPAR